MKSFIALALVSLTSLAFAAPKVGDSASYTATSMGMTFAYSTKLVGFNQGSLTFTKESITTIAGQDVVESEEISVDDLTSEETLAMVVEICETASIGKLETVTVPAGTFNTCAVVDENGGLANLGVVPFGFVKYTSDQVNMELTSFESGL